MGKNDACRDEGSCCGGKEDCGCGGSGGCGCGCACCGGSGFKRKYQTRAEKIEELEAYLGQLRLEVKAVEEHLADLKRKK